MLKYITGAALGLGAFLSLAPQAFAGCQDGDLYCSRDFSSRGYEIVREAQPMQGSTRTVVVQAPTPVADHPAISYAYNSSTRTWSPQPATNVTLDAPGWTFADQPRAQPLSIRPAPTPTYTPLPPVPDGLCPVSCPTSNAGLTPGSRVLGCYTVCRPAPQPVVQQRRRVVTTIYYVTAPVCQTPPPPPCGYNCGPRW